MTLPLIIAAAILAYLGVAVGLLPSFARRLHRGGRAGLGSRSQHRAVRDAIVFVALWPVAGMAFCVIDASCLVERLLDHAEHWIFKEGSDGQ